MFQPSVSDFDPKWSTALPDWDERLLEGKSIIPKLPLFDEVADRALAIFKRLRVPDIVGNPTYGETSEEWVFDLVRAIFGSLDPETMKRKIQEYFLLVPKKNGKSSIAAAIIVTAAIMNVRPDAELALIAPTQEIAKISFKQAKGIIALDQTLTKLFHIRDHLKVIKHLSHGAEIKVLSADGDVVTGLKAAFILVDETHVLGHKPKAADIFVELRGGLASRPEGFFLQITTQSKEIPHGQFRNELNRARAVRDGELDYPMLAVLYEFPQSLLNDEKWRDQKYWGLVNPNLERSVSLSFLSREYLASEQSGPDAVARFASQHLNVQIGRGLTQDRWIGASYWADAEIEYRSFDDFLDACEVVVAGVDGGGLDDLVGLSFVGRLTDQKIWTSYGFGWAQPPVLDRRKSIAPLLQQLAESGDLVICATPTQDLDEMVKLVGKVKERGLFPAERAVGLDPAGVSALVDRLHGIGLTEQQVVAVSQGYQLNGAIKGSERKLYDGSMRPTKQDLMTWCVSNCKTEQRGNAVVVTKAASGSGKIDPVMAMFAAFTLMSLNPTAHSGRSHLLDIEEAEF